MRIFKNKAFTRFAYKAGISDLVLCQAVGEAEQGLIGADLGGGVIKQRIARPGQGKSGGFRTLIVFRAGIRAILFTALQRAKKTISKEMSWRLSKSSQPNCWPMMRRRLSETVVAGVLVEVSCNEKAVS